jgi:tetratricopeptide (TPR) repeat protein
VAKELFDRAWALHVQGKVDEAIVALREALAVDGTRGRAWLGLGSLLEERGDIDEAIRCFREGVELRPFDEIAAGGLVFALRSNGQHEAARREALRFLLLVDETRVRLGADMHDDFEAIIDEADTS